MDNQETPTEQLFGEALEVSREQRTAFLDKACSGAPELRRAVEALLAENDRLTGFMSDSPHLQSPVEAGTQVADERRDSTTVDVPLHAPDDVTEGAVLGHYRLLEKIGEGGMGEVWLAEQREPIRRRVALKVIRAGMNTRGVMARFESERQALALMEHPAIARVLDAGSTKQGMPFFVMEYIAGVRITAYCDNHRLSTRERLELFVHVCEGVQHAHQKTIIHRDLKPSNILVTEVDGRPVPKIIDFGVAKALGQKLTADTLHTNIGALIGTPEYMSPEQASFSGEDIDTRSDIYSLGIILYELLAGSTPLQLRKASLEQFLKKLREEDVPKPSTRIRTQDPTASTDAARKRGTAPAMLVRQIRGELDAIALKALEKDCSRRYATASDFAADIGRYLTNQPVVAVAPSLAYRVKKFARRYRVGLITASAFALVLIVATAVSMVQSIRARREAAVAKAVNDFLQNDLLGQASSAAQAEQGAKPDPNITVRTVLDRAAQKVDGKFDRQPEVEVELRNTIAAAYIDLALYPEARRQAERALKLGGQRLGAENPATLSALHELGLAADKDGSYREAEALDRRALDARRRVLGPKNLGTLRTMNNLATTYMDEEKFADAEKLFLQTLAIENEVLDRDNSDRVETMDNLALTYISEQKYAQAETLMSEALAIDERVEGPDHPDTLGAMNNLATAYLDEGKYVDAEKLHVQALEGLKRVLGPDHPATLSSMGALAEDYMEEGRYKEAEALYLHVLEVARRVAGHDAAFTGTIKYDIACLRAHMGDKTAAIASLADAVDHGLPSTDALRMETDSDLASLRGDPRFNAVVAHAKQVASSKSAFSPPSN
jgi:non-specific serine/threonine protein kinase/serine/threonine-protein kinase